MMKVMGRARVESDRARSAFDSLARLRAVLAMVGGAVVDLRRESRMRKTHGCVEKSLGFAMGVPVRPGW